MPLVYAGFDANGTYRLFVTKDGGDSSSELPSPPSDGQLGFNNVITVGPYNSDEVYIRQIAFWRSFDGGTKGGRNDYHVSPPVESNSWTVLGCCLSDSIHSAKIWICTATMSYPGGGTVKVKVVATDADDASSSAEASVELKPCPSETPTQQR